MVGTHINYHYYNSSGAVYEYLQDTYEYDDEGKITSHRVTGNSPVTQSYSYDDFDRLASVTNSAYGGFYSKYEYYYKQYVTEGEATQSATRVDTYKSTVGTSTSNTSTTYTYTYDGNGYITGISRGTDSTNYIYDVRGQLVRENDSAAGKTYVYEYDKAGNIPKKLTYAYTTRTLSGATVLDTAIYGYTDESWGDLLTSYDGQSITYDGIGNPLSYYNGSSYSFTWEGRRLKTATKGNLSFTFTHNNDGIRTSKTVNGIEHTYTLNGTTILSEQWDNHVIIYIYDANGSPLGMQYRNSTYAEDTWDNFWFEKNIQGE